MQLGRTHLSVFALAALSLWGAACAPGIKVGSFSERAFMAERVPYYVELQPDGSILGSDWVIENLQPGEGTRFSKLGEEYEALHGFDIDGDGRFEESVKLARYDLLLRHRRTRATIWLSVFPISQQLADADADVLLREYIEAVSGAGSFTITMADGSKVSVSQQRRFATRQLDMTALTVQGQRAAGATFELANVDQLQLNQNSRWSRGRVLLIRTDATWTELSETWPIVMLAGYEHVPDRFDEHSQDFTNFLSHLKFIDDALALAPYLSTIASCAGVAQAATLRDLALRIDATGALVGLRVRREPAGKVVELAPCVGGASPPPRFAATGSPRRVVVTTTALAAGASRLDEQRKRAANPSEPNAMPVVAPAPMPTPEPTEAAPLPAAQPATSGGAPTAPSAPPTQP